MLYDALAVALQFLRAHPNWYIFPIERLRKFPPKITNNTHDASNNPAQIRQWHTLFYGCNWGLALRKSGLIVADVDTKPGKIGQSTFDRLELEYGEFPPTLVVQTPSGGSHWYYSGAHKFALGKYGFGTDIDSPNYVLLPGCWINEPEYTRAYIITNDAPVAEAPEWFAEVLGAHSAERNETASDEPVVDLDKPANVAWAIYYVTHGAPSSIHGLNGEKALYDTACVLKDRAISLPKAIEILATYYNVHADPLDPSAHPYCEPLWEVGSGEDKDRLDIKVENAYKYSRENEAGSTTAEFDFGDPEDQVRPEEVDALREATRKAKEEKDAKFFKDRYESAFTDAARGVETDPLTGEPYGDDDPDKPSNQQKAQEPPKEEAKAQEQAKPDEPAKEAQTLKWLAENWVWVVDLERFVRIEDSKMWKCKQFDSMFNHMSKKSSLSADLFKTAKIKRFDTAISRPGAKTELEGGTTFNLWRPSPIIPQEGDTNLWNEHLNYLFQDINDRDHVLNWCAWVYQNQRLKPNHALLIVGRNTGTGKSFIARIMEQLIGPANTQRPKNSSLKGDFNGWALRCKLCIIEELMQIGRREVANELRDMITEPTVEVNIKNIPAQLTENYMAMMGISNHPDALPIDETDRRWLVVSTPESRREPEYYQKLFKILDDPKALGAIAYELQHRQLGNYSAISTAPSTDAKTEMIEMSRSDVETWLYENMNNSPLCHNLVTVEDVRIAMPATLQKTARLSSTIIPTFLRDKLRGGKVMQVRLDDGSRVHLWGLQGRADMLRKLTPLEVSTRYQNERKAGFKTADQEAAEDFAE